VSQSEARNPVVPKHVELPKDFVGIEDVLNTIEGKEVIDGGAVIPGDIQEVSFPAKEAVIDGGTVSVRKRVAAAIMLLWVIWTLVSLIVYATTGNTALLLAQPAIMTIPLYKVLGYYF
jgi:hypothetical protein